MIYLLELMEQWAKNVQKYLDMQSERSAGIPIVSHFQQDIDQKHTAENSSLSNE